MRKQKINYRPVIRILTALIGTVICGLCWLLFQPLNLHRLQSHPEPSWSYEHACDSLKEQVASNALFDKCKTRIMTGGNQTAKVIVLIHDYTCCPGQFDRLAPELYNSNCNLLIARLPRHGKPDRLSGTDSYLTAEELTSFADSITDIAVMLGKKVVIAGVGAGAVTAAWTGLVRSDVESVVMITPSFHYKMVPWSSTSLATRILLTLPNRFIWIDPVLKADGTPAHIYPRYASHALGEIMRLGIDVFKRLEKNAPITKKFLVITNENDSLTDNKKTERFVNLLRKYPTEVSTYAFPQREQLGNDIIDPSRTYEQVDKVYPVIVGLISRH